jgi:hypothetical protein
MKLLIAFIDRVLCVLRTYFSAYDWPNNAYEAKYLLNDFFADLSRPMVKAARTRNTTSDRTTQTTFRTSKLAWQSYSIIIAALLQRQASILWLLAVLLIYHMSWILLRWTVFVLDDSDIGAFFKFCRIWIRRFVREGEAVLQGKDAVRYILAGSMLACVPSGMNYFRFIIRYNTRRANLATIQEMNHGKKYYQRVKGQLEKLKLTSFQETFLER